MRTLTKRIAQEVARRAVMEAGNLALGKSSQYLAAKAPEKIEELVDRKKDQYMEEAVARAEAFFQEKMAQLEARVDQKFQEIEDRFRESLMRELRLKLRLLAMTLGGLGLLGVLSLGYTAYRMWQAGG